MSKHHLREEKNCLNCGNTVHQRFCGNCGQENIEPRQTFGHLVAHFFEDLTHYEGKFWGTLRHLFFKPAFLSKEFLAGKRSKYLPPVRLYIFASFITFLLPAILPDAPGADSPIKIIRDSTDNDHRRDAEKDSIERAALAMASTVRDSLAKAEAGDADTAEITTTPGDIEISGTFGFDSSGFTFPGAAKTMQELDSAKRARASTDDPMGFIRYKFNKKLIHLRKYPVDLQQDIFFKALFKNIPKALFLYMPLFALILRLFHKRKNWIYFDHGIFTLHLFSFMLLTFLLLIFVSTAADWIRYLIPSDPVSWVFASLGMVVSIWVPYYLFRAHHKMYGESWIVSTLKTLMIILVNTVLFIGVIVCVLAITFVTLH